MDPQELAVGPSLVDQVKIAFENEIEFIGIVWRRDAPEENRGEIRPRTG